MGITVSQLADLSGVATDTLRYWEKAGLLAPPTRNANGYRSYEPATAERIRFIRGAQRAGLRLREIRELLDIQDRGACPCGHTQQIVAGRIAELDGELARLRKLRRQLVSLLETNDSCMTGNEQRWPCQDHLISLGGGDRR